MVFMRRDDWEELEGIYTLLAAVEKRSNMSGD